MKRVLILFLVTLFCISVRAKTTYEEYKVYRLIPSTKEQVESLHKLEEDARFDFWTDITDIDIEVKIMVSPKERDYFEKYLRDNNLNGNVVIDNVQELIDNQLRTAPVTNVRNARLGSFDWYNYHSLEEIYAWLDELEELYPNIVTVVVMGISFEGREIKGVKIDYHPGGRNNTLIGMYEGGLHAREWISPASLTWIIKEFLTSTDSDVRALARNLVWHIFPVVNPDGYTYTFTDRRMWRKNRNTNSYRECATGVEDDMSNGVDLNRNFNFVWMEVGASQDPCTNIYAGVTPFSESESLAISNYVLRLQNEGELIYYIAFHSFSQLIIMPYSHLDGEDVLQVGNYANLYEIGVRGADQISERYGTQYRVGVASQVLYKMSGTSFDWVRNNTGVPICFLFELRDLGRFGFLLPTEQIIPNNMELMDGLIEMDRVVRLMGYYSKASISVLSLTIATVSGILLILFK